MNILKHTIIKNNENNNMLKLLLILSLMVLLVNSQLFDTYNCTHILNKSCNNLKAYCNNTQIHNSAHPYDITFNITTPLSSKNSVTIQFAFYNDLYFIMNGFCNIPDHGNTFEWSCQVQSGIIKYDFQANMSKPCKSIDIYLLIIIPSVLFVIIIICILIWKNHKKQQYTFI